MKDEKILENELMSDEQLEEVVGGSTGEFIRDTRLMKALKLIPKAYDAKQLKGDNLRIANDMMNGVLAKYDLKIEVDANGANTYHGINMPGAFSRADFCKFLCERSGNPAFDYSKFL